jgi:hypothetical protein
MRLTEAGLVARTGAKRNAHKALLEKLEPFRRSGRRLEDNIKVGLKEID